MRNLENMLKNKAIECNKLVEYGFKKQENKYIFKNKIYNKQFEIVVIISDKQKTSKLIDLANDEEYSRITSNINLEEIKRIAIGELGMTYATEGQVIPYESDSNDYMRQADNSQN